MMRSTMLCAGSAAVLLCGGLAAAGDPTIEVIPASAPNAYGSPSYAGWVSNALYAIENGLSQYGLAGTPEFYRATTGPLGLKANMVTSFNSWKGHDDPGTRYGAGFANELGNRIQFGVHILGNGTEFSISQLSFVMDSTDSGDSLDYAFGEGGYNYSTDYVGVNYGPDQVKGGGDDVIITGGANTQLIDELIGRGSGNAWWPQVPDDGPTGQIAINNVAAALGDTPFDFTGTYTLNLGDDLMITGGNTVNFVPAPGPAALLATGLAAGAGRRRRR